MPHTSVDITAMLDLEQIGDDTFLGRHQHGTALAKVYGGQLFAQGLMAASRTTENGRPAHSAQAHFLTAGVHDVPVRYEVERIRDGRSFSTRAVRGVQRGRTVVALTASFHEPEDGLEHDSTSPRARSPEELPRLTEVMERASTLPATAWRAEWEGLDVRYDPANLSGPDVRSRGLQQVWMRTRDRLPDDGRLHRHVVAYLSDHLLLAAALVPHGLMLGDPELPRATLNHSVWFHSEARADEWLLFDQRSPWSGAGRGMALATIHSADGRLVASLAQEGLIRAGGGLRARLNID